MTDGETRYVSKWECPVCGQTQDSDDMYVPEVTTGTYHCSHCIQHGWGENEMEVLKYDD